MNNLFSIHRSRHVLLDLPLLAGLCQFPLLYPYGQLSVKPDLALIDGNRVPKNIKIPCETVVKGDFKSASIAAASILAKVTRDRLMEEYDEKYPEYNFKKHKGYGTKEHTELILKYGVSEVHRPSFLKKLLGDK